MYYLLVSSQIMKKTNKTNILTLKNEETEAWGGLGKLPKMT